MAVTVKKFSADVVVCGGGVAGAAAAISAGRAGKRVFLLEYSQSLGGLVTNGYITGIAGCVDGLVKEWLDRLNAEGHATMRPHLPVVEPEYGRVMLEQMVLQAGARILYGCHVVDVEKDGDRIKSVVCYAKNGRIELEADVFIDCTGDADLAFAAGCPIEVGNAEFMGLNQSVTMGFKLSYVNLTEYYAAMQAFRQSDEFEATSFKHTNLITHLEYKAIENGDLHDLLSPGNLVYAMPGDPTCTDVTIDATHTFDCHCDDVVDLTRQIVDQHRKVIWFVEFLQKYVPGFENAKLVSFAPMNGVRESRRVMGEYIMKATDIAAAKKFEDGIWQHAEVFDAHVPTPGHHTANRHIHANAPIEPAICREVPNDRDFNMHPFVNPLPWEIRTNPREYCEIPFRSLIAKGVDNLLVAGRCFSSDYHANGNIRIIAACMGMGQAAGIGASMIVDQGLAAARDLDGKLVREEMIRQGVNLNEAPGGYWKTIREFKGEIFVNGGDMADIRNEKGESPYVF